MMAVSHDSERLRGFDDGQKDRLTDICDSRVALANEKDKHQKSHNSSIAT